MTKKTILIDLDGVLNEYTGNFDEKYIPKIRYGAKSFLKVLSKNFYIKLFTTRNKLLVSRWVIENGIDNIILDITNIKEPCWLYVDDRCINFTGDFEDLKSKIKDFKPWYK